MRPNRTPPTLLAAALAAALAGCAERTAPPGADGPESPKEAARDGPEVPDPKVGGPLAREAGDEDAAGGTRFTVTRSDVRDSGDAPGNPLANQDGYFCDGVEDCWEKCPPPEKDGTSTLCSCKWVAKGRAFCTVRTISNDGGDGSGGGCGGGGEDDDIDDEDPLASCPAPDFTVRLSCRNAFVTRGQRVSCTAYPSHNKGEVVYNWAFEPDGGGVHIRNGGHFEQLLEVRQDNVTSGVGTSTWTGQAVHGGTVRVMATDDSTGYPAYGVDGFRVDARSGWKIRKLRFREGPNLTNHLWLDAPLGQNVNIAGNAKPAGVAEGAAMIGVVSEGPNKGYAYVSYQNYYVGRFWRVNQRLLATGPKEIPDTVNGQYPVPVRHWDYLIKRKKNPQHLAIGTAAHERYGRLGMKGHQGQIEKALTAAACGDVAAIAEGVVANTHARAMLVVSEQVEGVAALAFAQAALHHHVYGHHGSAGSPIVWWKPGWTPQVTVYRDARDPDPQHYAPGCDWLSF